MPTPRFVCGAECGIAAVGTLSGGTEHWSSIVGTPTVVTSGPSPMRSTRCFRFNQSASIVSLTHTLATAVASPATIVVRFYVYFTTLPAVDSEIFVTDFGACIRYIASNTTLRAAGSAGSNAASGATVVTGRWYRIDAKFVSDVLSSDLQVDGVAQTQFTTVVGGGAVSGFFKLGSETSTTADFYIDDFVMSATSGDYPIGVGTVAGLYPNADGTHSFAAGNFFKNGSTATAAASTDTNIWQSLTSPLSTAIDTTKFVTDAIGTNTLYVEFAFADLPSVISVNGVMVALTSHSSSALANAQRMQLNDNGTTTGYVLGTAVPAYGDLSETTIATHVATFATAPSTAAAWTKTLVDGLKVRWGLSNDVSPTPFLDGVCLEVDFVPGPVTKSLSIRQAIRRATNW